MALARQLGVPAEVIEYLETLAEDYDGADYFRIAREGDSRALKLFDRTLTKAPGKAYHERFYWDGVGYLIGFSYPEPACV